MRSALCVPVLLAMAATGRADNVGDAQLAMKRGVAAQQKGELDAALTAFQEAIRLVPEAPVPYRYAGEALEQLGRFAEAVASFESYLRLRPDSLDAASVRERIAKIRREHLDGGLDVMCTPKGAEVLIDDAATPAGVTPLKGVQLPAGKHTVLIRAPGYTSRTLDVEVVTGTSVVVPCDLARVAPPPVDARRRSSGILSPDGPPDDDEAPRWYSRWWVWAGAAAVVGGAAAVYFVTRPDLPDTDGGDLHFP